MIVELQIFSGRRNPSWHFTDDEMHGFMALVKTITESVSPRAMPENLGYRGFLVTREDNEPGHFATIYVFQNIALVEGANTPKYYRDTEKKLEKYLLELASKHLDNDLWSKLQYELERESGSTDK